jgi:hypothetical protein
MPSGNPAPLDRALRGGDRRSIGNANRVAARVLKDHHLLPKLIECLWSDDPIVRMRSADAAEKVSLKKPHLLEPFKSELLGLATEATQSELRWHLALMLPRLGLSVAERKRARGTLRNYLNDHSSIVKTCAIQGIAELARGDAALEIETIEFLETASLTGTPAMRARSRKLLKDLQRS